MLYQKLYGDVFENFIRMLCSMAVKTLIKMPDPIPNQESLEALAMGEAHFKKLEAQLVGTHRGKAVAIEPVSGDFFLGGDYTEAIRQAHQQYPGRILYVGRIGPFVPPEGYRHHPSTITMQDIYDPGRHRKRL